MQTAAGSALLLGALMLVKFVRLSAWRRTLGRLVPPEEAKRAEFEPADQARAAALAGWITRATERLPLATKCLARAVALQWRLRLSGISSLLMVAFHATDREGEHAFHAWVERDGQILIGACDRASYRPIMIFAQGVPRATLRTSGPR